MKSKITLYHGDCLEVMKTIPDKSIDMILCDLPYGITACKWDVIIPFEPLWEQYRRIIKNNGAIVLTASQPFTSALVMSNVEMFKYTWVWVKNKKTGFLNAKKQPLRQVEDVVVFYKKQPTYIPQKTHGHKPVNSFTKHTSDGSTMGKTKIGITGGGQTDRYPSNVLTIPVVNNDNSNGDKFYPTQKPVALFEYLIKTYTLKGETVLDNCMGSGSTGVACKRLKRNYIGIEKNFEGFTIAKNRIENTKEVI
jgi:site-specific DNA-methyltransferase (adenine-specific)